MCRVTSRDNFFLSELAYASEDAMVNTKPVTINVATLGGENLCGQRRNNVAASSHADGGYESQLTSSAAQVAASDIGDVSNAVSQHSNGRKQVDDRTDSCHFEECPESEGDVPPVKCARVSSVNGPTGDSVSDVEVASAIVNEVFEKRGSAQGFILDFDLDFFSTVDPFLSVLSHEQYRLVSELYHFTPPADATDEVCTW